MRVKTPTPTVTAITPNTQVRGWNVNITNLPGTNFRSGAIVSLVNGSSPVRILLLPTLSLYGSPDYLSPFDLSSATAAPRNVTVTNQYSDTGTFTNGFTVTGNAPTLTARNVRIAVDRGSPAGVSLTGTGLPTRSYRATDAGRIFRYYCSRSDSTITDANHLHLKPTWGATGTWNILVINPMEKPPAR